MAAKKSKYYEMCYIIHTIGNLTVFKLFTVGEIVIEYGKYDRTGGSHCY